MTAARQARKQEERSEATQRALVVAARRLFARQGYAGTSIEQIVREARVTRGALYHHFAEKRAVFLAVYEDAQRWLTGNISRAASSEADGWEQVRAGCRAFLQACLEPLVQRVILADAPSVLDWDTWRRIEESHFLALIERGIRRAAKSGLIRSGDPGALARLLFGALCEAGVVVATAAEPGPKVAAVWAEFDALLGSLRVPHARRSLRDQVSKPSAP